MAGRFVSPEQLRSAAAALRPAPSPAGTKSAESVPAQSDAEQEALPRVAVRFMDGTDMEFDMDLSNRGSDLRLKVSTKLGLTEARVKLMFGSQLLQMNQRLSKAGIADGAVVNAVVVPPLYQGSQVYSMVAEAYASACDADGVRRRGDEIGEDVHSALEAMMDKKAKLNDAFAKLRLRK